MIGNLTFRRFFLGLLCLLPLYSLGSTSYGSVSRPEPLLSNQRDTLMLFRFQESDPQRAALAGVLVSLDQRDGDIYTAYANRAEMKAFLAAGFEVMEYLPMETVRPKMALMGRTLEEMQGWNRYPIYQVYIEMMQDFASRYPEICRLDTIGYSVENRLILGLKISDKVGEEEAEPNFFYSSSIHGDELTGFVLMLRLADTLLSGYGHDEELTSLVDQVQIYINPLANPDGAYSSSETDVSGSFRYNAHYVDLNRNYPDPFGKTPEVEKENLAMMAYMERIGFTMSVNIHGGATVVNFPWDSFTSRVKKHADYDWWVMLAKRYVDSCRRVSPGVYGDVETEGYVHGGDWYVVGNGRQDYVNYCLRSRELTLEISQVKCPSANQLPQFWAINHRSLINHIKEVTYGIQGRVYDSVSGLPLRARVSVLGHDKDSSQVYSSAVHGGYFRPIAEGTYSLLFEAPGYRSKVVEGLVAEDFKTLVCDVALVNFADTVPEGADTLPEEPDTVPSGVQDPNAIPSTMGDDYRVVPNPVKTTFEISSSQVFRVQAILDRQGRKIGPDYPSGRSMERNVYLDFSGFPSGLYLLRVERPGNRFSVLRVIRN